MTRHFGHRSSGHQTERLCLSDLYEVKHRGELESDATWANSPSQTDKAGSVDDYTLALDPRLSEFIGQLYVDWGKGRKWIQRADNQNKRIVRGGSTGETLCNDLEQILQSPNTQTVRKALVDARLGQGEFRSNVLRLWDGHCAVSGSSTLVAIRASHIKPWRDSTDQERLDPFNGLPLIANLDALFDAGLISFAESGEILLSEGLDEFERETFQLSNKALARAPSPETARFLRYHRENVFQNQSGTDRWKRPPESK